MPGLDELGIDRRIDGLEVVPGGKVADKRCRVETGKLFFTDGEGDDRDVFSLDALVAEFLVERHVGVAVDGRDDGGLLAGRAKFLDVGDDRLPVGMTERRVVDHDVLFLDALGHQVGLQDLVGRLRIDIVGAGENPALHAFGRSEVIDGRDCLLVRSSTGVEDVARGFFTLVLDRVEEDRVQLFKDRQHRFARRRGPATEDGGNLVLGDQLTGFFGKQRPVGGRIDDNGFELLSKHAALLVLLFDEHQHGVFQRGFRNRHCAGERMKNADLDRVVGRECAVEGRGGKCGSQQRSAQFRLEAHRIKPPLFWFVGTTVTLTVA
ncbi:hypothetical protein D3C73_778460 [compost metagenome]